MTNSKSKLGEKDPFLGLARANAGGSDDFFTKKAAPAFSLEDEFSKDLLDGGDLLFARDSVFRDVSESNNYDADFSEPAFDVEWDGMLLEGTPKSSTSRAIMAMNRQTVASVNGHSNKRSSTRGRARVRRLNVAPAADTAPPEAQAKVATPAAKRTSLLPGSDMPRLTSIELSQDGELRSRTPNKDAAPRVSGEMEPFSEGVQESNQRRTSRKENAQHPEPVDTSKPTQTKHKSNSETRPTRIRALIKSGAKEGGSVAGRSTTHPKEATPKQGDGLSKSVHSKGTTLSGDRFKKSASDGELKRALLNGSKQKAEKSRSQSIGPLRSSRKKSTSSDTSNATHDMSNSTDGKSSKNSKVGVDPVDSSSDDESSIEDIFESPPQRPKKPVSVAAKRGSSGSKVVASSSNSNSNNLLVDCRHPQQKVDGLSARTSHDRVGRGVSSARSQTSKDSGNLSDGDIHLDSRPRAPARKKSMDYEDFLTLRESLAKEERNDQTPRLPVVARKDYFPKKR